MKNQKINQLYKQNYIIDEQQPIKFNNPFFIQTEQQLLNAIYKNMLSGKPLFQGAPATAPVAPIAPATAPIAPVAPVAPLAPDTKDKMAGDSSINPRADYYQRMVYEPVGDRRLYPGGDAEVSYEQLDDDRHMVTYDAEKNIIHVAHRGTEITSIWDIVIDLAATARMGTGKLNDRIDFNTINNPLTELEEKEIDYHIEYIDKVLTTILKDHPNATLDLSGHSKGGMNAQMVLAYLENYINDRPPKYNMKNTRVYTYNSAPWEWEAETNHPNIYPRRVRGDSVSMIWGAGHPNLKTITHTGDGKQISMLDAHSSDNFFNQDFSKVKSLKEGTMESKKLEALRVRDGLEEILKKIFSNFQTRTTKISREEYLKYIQAQINLYKSQLQLTKIYDNSRDRQKKIKNYESRIKLHQKDYDDMKKEII